jgi:hypothetical protein
VTEESPVIKVFNKIIPARFRPGVIAFYYSIRFPTANNRTYKTLTYLDQKSPPEAVIVGSSRAFKYAPATLERLTGLRAFNAAVDGGAAFYLMAFTRMMLGRRRPPKMIFFALEAQALIQAPPWRLGLLYDSVLWSYTREAKPPDYTRTFMQRLGLRLPARPLNRIGGRLARIHRRLAPNYWFGPDGMGYFAHERLSFDPDTDVYIQRYRHVYRHPRPLDQKTCDTFEEWLRLCAANDIVVKVVLSPWHPYLLDILFQETHYPETHASALEFLHTMAAKHGFDFYDFTDLESFGGEVSAFFDSVHCKPANADRIMEAVFASP